MLTPTESADFKQSQLFGNDLLFQLAPKHPLLCLAEVIPWPDFDKSFPCFLFAQSCKPGEVHIRHDVINTLSAC